MSLQKVIAKDLVSASDAVERRAVCALYRIKQNEVKCSECTRAASQAVKWYLQSVKEFAIYQFKQLSWICFMLRYMTLVLQPLSQTREAI